MLRSSANLIAVGLNPLGLQRLAIRQTTFPSGTRGLASKGKLSLSSTRRHETIETRAGHRGERETYNDDRPPNGLSLGAELVIDTGAETYRPNAQPQADRLLAQASAMLRAVDENQDI
jgi:hypothetical protein